jgi:hypothetical protein
MKPSKIILFTITALIFAAVAAMFGAMIATAAGFAGEAGAVVAGSVSIAASSLRLFAPGIFGAAAFMAMPMAIPPEAQRILDAPIYSQKRALLDAIVLDNLNQGFEHILPLAGYLRSEVILGVANSIEFPLRDNENAPGQPVFSTENRLRQNDSFYPTDFSVMFYTFDTTVAGARQRARLQTFGNPNVFGLNAPEVNGAYNGNLSLRVNETVFMDSLDMQRFKFAEAAQQGVAVSAVAGTGVIPESTVRQSEAFAHEDAPLVRLNGMFNNRFAIRFPDVLDFTLEAENDLAVVAVLYLRGWLMQNGGNTRSAK